MNSRTHPLNSGAGNVLLTANGSWVKTISNLAENKVLCIEMVGQKMIGQIIRPSLTVVGIILLYMGSPRGRHMGAPRCFIFSKGPDGKY